MVSSRGFATRTGATDVAGWPLYCFKNLSLPGVGRPARFKTLADRSGQEVSDERQRKRYTPEQISVKLREIDAALGASLLWIASAGIK